MNIPEDLLYSKTHEWVRVDGQIAQIGITDYAQTEMGDIVFVELPQEGDEVEAEEGIGVLESVKAVSDIICPVAGIIDRVNEQLEDAPELLNQDPYGAFLVEVRISRMPELMSAQQYRELIAQGA